MVLEDNNELEREELSRNATQRIALSAIYDILLAIDMGNPVDVESILSGLCDCPYSEVDPFLKSVCIMFLKNHSTVIEAFSANMRGWTFDRLNFIVRSILCLAYVHYCYVEPDTDRGVVINIAVKFAKAYCEEKDYKFVNAILDHTLPKRKKEDDPSYIEGDDDSDYN